MIARALGCILISCFLQGCGGALLATQLLPVAAISAGGQSSKTSTSPEFLSDLQLCSYIYMKNASMSGFNAGEFVDYVSEENNRGIDCEAINNIENKRIASALSDANLVPAASPTKTSSNAALPNKEPLSSAAPSTQSVSSASNLPAKITTHSNKTICRLATQSGAWDTSQVYANWVSEAKRRGLSCGVKKAQIPETSASENNQSIKSTQLGEVIVEGDFEEVVASNNSQGCSNLQKKIDSHINKSEYDKAQQALELMKSMNCENSSSQSSQTTTSATDTAPPKPKYSASDLACSAGPIWRPNFGRDTVYFNVRSFDDNPRNKCKFAVARCDAYAQAAAHGTQVPKQFRLPNSYSANCHTSGSIITSTDCTITPNTGGGGFVGGFADGLNQGLRTLMAKKNAMVSTFQSCMADEGYSLTKR
jgi:hypothetical protein